MKKRFMSMVLMFCLMFSMNATAVFAQTDVEAEGKVVQEKAISITASKLKTGGTSTVAEENVYEEVEPNDYLDEADLIEDGDIYLGEAGNSPYFVDDDIDCYEFKLTQRRTVYVSAASQYREGLRVGLSNEQGEIFWEAEFLGMEEGLYTYGLGVILEPGVYYIAVWDENEASYSSTIEYAVYFLTEAAPTRVNPFNDVREADYFYEPVLWAVENGITSGKSATTFAPNDICTRGDVVTFLWRAAGCPKPTSTTCNFTDIGTWNYYYDAVRWAVEAGITTGTSPTTFAPEKQCTRADVATFLWRAAGCPEPSSTRCNFNDVSSEGYYYKAVLWAVENGITAGTSDYTFEPYAQCTRAQIVTFLYRSF